MQSLIVEGEQIPLVLKRDKRYKNTKIFFSNGILHIISPRGPSKSLVNQIVKNHGKHILKSWSFEKSKLSKDSERYSNGGQFMFRGKLIRLKIIFTQRRNIHIWDSSKELILEIPKEKELLISPLQIKKAIINWYKKMSMYILNERMDFFAQMIGVKYNLIRYKTQKSRWGSCSSKGNINLNWLIIMAPDDVIDYIIIHELCHLKYMNHSPSFWNLVNENHPNFLESRTWLKQNGHTLSL